MPTRVPSFKGSVGAFSVVGEAAGSSKLLAIFNKTGSGVLVAVRRLTLQTDLAGSSSTGRAVQTTFLTTAPTDGTLLDPQAWDTTQTHNANVEIRGRATADGTNGTLTASVPSGFANSRLGVKNPGGAGQFLAPDYDLLVDFPYPEDPLILREGEGVLVRVVEAGSNSLYYLVNAMIEEFVYEGSLPPVGVEFPYIGGGYYG